MDSSNNVAIIFSASFGLIFPSSGNDFNSETVSFCISVIFILEGTKKRATFLSL